MIAAASSSACATSPAARSRAEASSSSASARDAASRSVSSPSRVATSPSASRRWRAAYSSESRRRSASSGSVDSRTAASWASALAWASASWAWACSSATATASSLALVARARSRDAWSAASASMISTSARVSSRRRSASSRAAWRVTCSSSSSWAPAWASARTRRASARAWLTSWFASTLSWSASAWARVSRESASSAGLTGDCLPVSPALASRVDPSDTLCIIPDLAPSVGPNLRRAPGTGRLAARAAACSRGRPVPPKEFRVSARLFTSESVTEGHPHKICDQISDAILDAMLAQDPRSRVAVETMVTTGLVHVAGEVTTEAYVEIPKIVRDTVLRIGYDSSTKGFDGASCGVSASIGQQSPDIAQGVDTAFESRTGGVDPLDKQGAGDQGLMFGYATDDTPELMPLPIFLAHRLAERLTAVRKTGELTYLRPDGKTQVTIAYDGDRAVSLDAVVVSTQHAEDISIEGMLEPDIRAHVIDPVLAQLSDAGTSIRTEHYRAYINPTGKFVIGGPIGDAGLTGRKIIVDTYGGMARHGGGAFSG